MNTCVICGKSATFMWPQKGDDIPFCEDGLSPCFQKWFSPIMWGVLSVPHKKKDSERVLSNMQQKKSTT